MRIVALHGQMGMARDWDSLSEALDTRGHRLDAVDLWSYLYGGEVTLEKFGAMLNEDQDNGQVLLGYSMGGRLALHAMIQKPRKWTAAVIISVHTGLMVDERGDRRKVDNDWASKLATSPWEEFLKEWNKQEVLGKHVMMDRSILETKKIEIARSFKCWSLAEQENILDKLSMIDIPVLWIVGEKDEKYCKLGEQAVKFLKNAQLLKIRNSGHRVPWEAEAEVVDAITQFLNEAL